MFTKPITVRSSALLGNSGTMLRYALVALGGILVSRGYLSDETLNDIVGALLVIVPALYGIYKNNKNHDDRVAMANILPDSVATVK